jgi:hypothetical protein
MVIQIILLAAIVVFLLTFIRSRHGVRMNAGKRLAFVLFLLINAYAVVRPNDVTALAQLVGVGRGTDLLLYALVVAFTFVVINFYLRSRELDEKTTRLARAVALREAESANRDRGLIPEARPVTNTNDQLAHGPETAVTP